MPFSRQGLIDQLTSEYGSQFAIEDATFAVDHIAPDWNAEAVEAAQSYIETIGGFSRQGLIDQLTSEYGSQFTAAEAEYADQRQWGCEGADNRPLTLLPATEAHPSGWASSRVTVPAGGLGPQGV